LSDFEPAKHAVPTDQLAEIDRYMLGKLTETVKEVKPYLNRIPFIFH
jgi:isoleucyl-tRNA synthetase